MKSLNTLRQLKVDLHSKYAMPSELHDRNLDIALTEIERDNQESQLPLEQRGGEVLDQVNEVFNLMAVKIKMNA